MLRNNPTLTMKATGKFKSPKTRAAAMPPSSGMKRPTPATTLIAVVGVSPAILTETVWALANPRDGSAPIIPNEVIAITTLRGEEAINKYLQTASARFGGATVWQSLKRDLLGPSASEDERLTLQIKVIERPDPATGSTRKLSDIQDRDQNMAAAEFILREVRFYSSTKDRIVASLAGGRKTMGALLHAAFSHLARPQDRLTHILVSEPYDTLYDAGRAPLFFYPTQPDQVLTRHDGKPFTASEAKLELAEVPFAPLRLRFPDIADIPTRFRDLVQTYVETFKRDATKPALIELKSHPPRVAVDGQTVELEGERQLTVIEFLLLANQKEWLEKNQDEALEIFKAWHGHLPQLRNVRASLRPTIEQLHKDKSKEPGPDWIKNALKEDIKRPLSFWRRALERTGSLWQPPQRDLRFPPFKLVKKS